MQTQTQTPNDKIETIDKQIAKNNKSIKTSKIVNIAVWIGATVVGTACAIFTAGLAQWFVPVMAGCSALLTTRVCTELSGQLKSSNKGLENEKTSIQYNKQKQQKRLEREQTETKQQKTQTLPSPQTEIQNTADGEEISIA